MFVSRRSSVAVAVAADTIVPTQRPSGGLITTGKKKKKREFPLEEVLNLHIPESKL